MGYSIRHQCAFIHRRPFMGIMLWTFVILALTISGGQGQDDLTSLCRSAASRQSCGQCIKQNPQCVWCTDPAFAGDFRCDVENNLIDSCPPQFLYQAKSNVQITKNVEAGTFDPQYELMRQIQPQEVHVLIKPGESVTFPLKFFHNQDELRDLYILNSETESQGVYISYAVNCKGVDAHSRECKGVRKNDLITFNVTVQIQGCSSNTVASIGTSGVREVLALYVHPQCGCDCERPEKQEQRSGHCSGSGTLVCGACICDDPRQGGRNCECQLGHGQTTGQLEDSCRQEPHKPLCNGHGHCQCGTCVCDPPNQYSGQFCDCDQSSCPLAETNGQMCGGRGRCHCGACECEGGYTGIACTCSTETDGCLTDGGKICSGRGSCVCNKCNCVDGYEGSRCEHQLGHAPTFQPTDTTTDDDDDQDDDDDDDDHTEPMTPDTIHTPVDGHQSGPEPEPEPESKSESDSDTSGHNADDGENMDGEHGTAHETPADGEPTAEPSGDKTKSVNIGSLVTINIFTCFTTLAFLALVNRR